MIETILPLDAAVGESFTDLREEPLFAEEEAAIAGAVDKRRREFRAARGCARRALSRFGARRLPMIPGRGGSPSWPPGFAGSITHCDGYCAAAVARTECLRSIGIDSEPHVPLPPGVIELVAMPTERRHLADLHGVHPEVRWDTVLFSAKESVYKAWFPLTFRWLGFTDAAIEIDDACGTFTAHLVEDAILDDRSLARISGRWLVKRGLVLTAVTVPPLA